MAEPTSQDIAAVEANINPQPAPEPQAPAPTPQPTEPPTQEPAQTPTPPAEDVDPFASMFQEPAPTETQPTPPPTEEVKSQPSPTPAPTPTAPETNEETPKYETYEQYMDRVMANVPKAPEAPDPSKVNADSPEEIKKFFDDMMTTAEQRIEAKIERKNAIKAQETKLWNEAFTKYPTLKSNVNVRNMVHNIRMGYFHRGQAITPLQAAKELIDSMSGSYKKGVADNQVVTTIESTQPTGGNTPPSAPTTMDAESMLQSVQTGGEEALAELLDKEIKSGRL